MSQENVEIVRRLYSLTPNAAGVVRGDYDNAFVDNFHPDVEIVPPSSYPDTPESGYRGPEGMLRWFQQLDEIWDDWRFEAERFLDAGDRVVAFVRVSGSAKQSGAALTISTAHVLTLRDGRVTRVDVFLDRPEALEAAGLPEEAVSHDNVELTQRAYDAFNQRDMGAFLALMAPDVVAESRLAAMEGGYHGHDGIRQWWQNLLDAFPDFTLETVEAREHGNLTLTTLRSRGHGADSDTPFVDTVWVVVHWRDEKAIRWRILSTEAEALEAVGLRE